MDKEKPDIGREEVTKDPKDHGAFKTPTIRNVALSAPYMHDGSQKTLEEVVEWYAKGGHPNPILSEKIKKLDLTDQDKKDLVEFMKQGCTSDFPESRARPAAGVTPAWDGQWSSGNIAVAARARAALGRRRTASDVWRLVRTRLAVLDLSGAGRGS